MADIAKETNWIADSTWEAIRQADTDTLKALAEIPLAVKIGVILAILTHGKELLDSVKTAVAEAKRKYRAEYRMRIADIALVGEFVGSLDSQMNALATHMRYAIESGKLPSGEIDSKYIATLRKQYVADKKRDSAEKAVDSAKDRLAKLDDLENFDDLNIGKPETETETLEPVEPVQAVPTAQEFIAWYSARLNGKALKAFESACAEFLGTSEETETETETETEMNRLVA